MKHILLQHYAGQPKELEQLSIANMKRYAEFCGVDYKLVTGFPFHSKFSPPCQKVCMLSEEYDDYDTVVMVDTDMFTANNLQRNIFTEETGIGIFTDQMRRFSYARIKRKFPRHSSEVHPYWGGAIWRLDRDVRQLFRKHIDFNDLHKYSGNLEDEGIMHRLAMLADYRDHKILDDKWCYCSFRTEPETAYMIHVREKIYKAPDGTPSPRQEKILNYRALRKKGFIDE